MFPGAPTTHGKSVVRVTAKRSRKGNPHDNAIVETFFHSLKTELVYFENYHTREQATQSIFDYIKVFYNRIRKHSAIGYCSPVEFEIKQAKAA